MEGRDSDEGGDLATIEFAECKPASSVAVATFPTAAEILSAGGCRFSQSVCLQWAGPIDQIVRWNMR
jgi:hypothetical protein